MNSMLITYLDMLIVGIGTLTMAGYLFFLLYVVLPNDRT